MKFCTQVFLLLTAVTIGLVYQQYYNLTYSRPVPKFKINTYWGPGVKSTNIENTVIKTKDIRYSDGVIKALQKKLNESLNLHAPLEGIGFEYGINSNALLEFVNYWRDEYLPKCNEREAYLNTFQHFTTHIQG